MNRYVASLLLIIMLFIAVSPIQAYQIIGIENFKPSIGYEEKVFSDVLPNDWYYDNVASAYEYALMSGKGNSKFDPNANLLLSEAIVLATRIHYTYFYASSYSYDAYEEFEWYEPYVNYALSEGIIASEYVDYNAPATRAEFAKILANSMDSVEFTEINYVDDGAIPDVPIDSDCAESVYLLYRAGIIAGSDETGTFYPDSTITRAEAAAIITRMIDPSLRRNIELYGEY